MDNEIYAPPETSPETIIENTGGEELATRISRLGAAILDGIIMSVVTLPIMYLTGGFDDISDPNNQHSLVYTLGMAALGIVIFAVLNFKLLSQYGQTIGKKIVGIKIVNMEGNLPDLKTNILKRYAVYFLIAQVPVVGPIFNLVNILFIFRKDQRCIHDLAGETKVIKV